MGGLRVGAAALAAAALTPAAPGMARPPQRQASVALSGGLTISWRADQARGCERAGLCGYSGSLTWSPGPEGQLSFQPPFPPSLILDSAATGIVRVRRDGGGTCVDTVSNPFFELEGHPLGGHRYGLRFPDTLSAGRCAGPSAADLSRVLPSPALDLDAVRGRKAQLHWIGGALAAGPWVGEIGSTLSASIGALHVPRSETRRIPAPKRLRGRTLYTRFATYGYRVARASGAIVVDLHGAASSCAPLDACATTGVLTLSPAPRGIFELLGAGESLRPHPRLVFSGDGYLRAGGRTGAVLRRAGAPDCVDARAMGYVPVAGERRGGGFTVTLGAPDAEFGDVLRTRCPGPAQSDVFGRGILARGTLPATALGARRLRLVLRATGTFSAPGYGGSRSGGITIDLVRTRVRHGGGRRRL